MHPSSESFCLKTAKTWNADSLFRHHCVLGCKYCYETENNSLRQEMSSDYKCVHSFSKY